MTIPTMSAPVFKAVRIDDPPAYNRPLVDAPDLIYAAWRNTVIQREWYDAGRECLVVFLVNARRRLMGVHCISQGTIDTALVTPRDIFRMAILTDAYAVIMAHNHPSGDPSPSEADIKITRDLIRAGRTLKIDVLDHVVIGDCNDDRARPWMSLREIGIFYE